MIGAESGGGGGAGRLFLVRLQRLVLGITTEGGGDGPGTGTFLGVDFTEIFSKNKK